MSQRKVIIGRRESEKVTKQEIKIQIEEIKIERKEQKPKQDMRR